MCVTWSGVSSKTWSFSNWPFRGKYCAMCNRERKFRKLALFIRSSGAGPSQNPGECKEPHTAVQSAIIVSSPLFTFKGRKWPKGLKSPIVKFFLKITYAEFLHNLCCISWDFSPFILLPRQLIKYCWRQFFEATLVPQVISDLYNWERGSV